MNSYFQKRKTQSRFHSSSSPSWPSRRTNLRGCTPDSTIFGGQGPYQVIVDTASGDEPASLVSLRLIQNLSALLGRHDTPTLCERLLKKRWCSPTMPELLMVGVGGMGGGGVGVQLHHPRSRSWCFSLDFYSICFSFFLICFTLCMYTCYRLSLFYFSSSFFFLSLFFLLPSFFLFLSFFSSFLPLFSFSLFLSFFLLLPLLTCFASDTHLNYSSPDFLSCFTCIKGAITMQALRDFLSSFITTLSPLILYLLTDNPSPPLRLNHRQLINHR